MCNTDHSGLKEAEILSGTFKKKKEKTRPTWVHRRIVWPWTSNYIFPVSLSITEVCMCAAYAADVTLGTARTSITHTHTHTHTHTSAASILGLDLNSPRCCCNSLQSHQLNCSLPKEKKKKRGHFPLLTCSVDSPLTSHLSSLSLSLTGSPSLPLMQTSFFFSSSFFF